tara:strand:- start:7495 stop:8133 length:639 start_codon:yes stop_codon:yes gene_type:complete
MVAKTDAVRRSPAAIIANSKNARRHFDKLWNAASKAPIFCKISSQTLPDGEKKKRFKTSRLISSHAYKIAQSGAALHASRLAARDCGVLRLDAETESSRAPWMPSLSAGARIVLEQFLAALAQEAAFKADAFREGCGNTKRISAKHMRLGWEATKASVFASSSMIPSTVLAMPIEKKRWKPKPKPAVQDKTDGSRGEAPAEKGNIEDVVTGD